MIAFIDDHREWGRADLQGLADSPLALPRRCRDARRPGEALRALEAGYGAEAGDRPRLCGELRGLWRAQGLAAIAARELCRCPLHRGAGDERCARARTYL